MTSADRTNGCRVAVGSLSAVVTAANAVVDDEGGITNHSAADRAIKPTLEDIPSPRSRTG